MLNILYTIYYTNRNMSKSIRNDTFPSVSKASDGQGDTNRNSKRQTGGKTNWASK